MISCIIIAAKKQEFQYVKTIYSPQSTLLKSRQTLALLQEHNVDVEVVEYLKTPLQSAELESIKSKLGISSFIEMMRTKEAEFKEAQLSKVDSSESDFLSAMVEYPKLIERPIVMTEDSGQSVDHQKQFSDYLSNKIYPMS